MITIYEANAVDFAGNGLGVLTPESCTVTETLNGEYELTLVHPPDDFGKWKRIQEGRILRAPVPAGKTPYIRMNAAVTATEIYRVNVDGRLNLRKEPSMSAKILRAYRSGTEVVVIDHQSHDDWSEVTTPDGKHGWMWTDYLRYVRTETSAAAAEESIIEARTLRDQPFRIYKVVPTLQGVTAYARHIFYDLMDNMVSEYKPGKGISGAAAMSGLADATEDEHEFSFYSDLDSTAEDVEIYDTNPAEALMGSGGLMEKYGGELQRDWWDVFIAKRVGEQTQIEIREGKNLLGISYSYDTTAVKTRIIPRGEDKDGERLYLPERYIDSEHIGDYPTVKWYVLPVSEAKEKTNGDNRLSKEECYELMRKAAAKVFEEGGDLPKITLNVDYIDCAETEEYGQYRQLKSISMGDTVLVWVKKIGLSVPMRMTKYSYNCLTKQYISVTLGTPDTTLESSIISPGSLGAGTISGGILKPGSVGGGQLADGAVTALKIALAAIGYAHIDEAAIDQLAANALVAVTAEIERLAAGEITTDELYAALAKIAVAQITAANIENANIEWAQIEALTAQMAQIANAQIGTAEIDYAKIVDMVTNTAIFTTGEAGRLYVNRLVVTEANMAQLTVGKLMLKDEEGNFVQLLVGADGNVTTQLVQVEGGNIADSTISGSNLIEDTITARELNVAQIFADEALIRAIRAANIDVADLFAAEATIGELESFIVKASTIEALKGQLSLWADDKIELAVRNGLSGGTQLLRDTKDMTVGYTVDTWQTGENRTREEGADGFAEIHWNVTGQTEAGFPAALSPVTRLPDGWQGRRGVLSAWVYSEDWSTLDGGMYWAVSVSKGDRVRVRYAMPIVIRQNGELGGTVIGERPVDGEWTRLAVPVEFSEEGLDGEGVLSDATHVYAGFYCVKNGVFRIKSPKLEFGTEATGWTPYPEEFTAGSSVRLTENEIRLRARRTLIEVPSETGDTMAAQFSEDGMTARSISCPNVAPRYDGGQTLTVNPSATDDEVKAGTHFRSLADALATINGRQLDRNVTIYLAGGMQEYGDLAIRGVCGTGMLTIMRSGEGAATLYGTMRIRQCTAEIEIYALDVAAPADARYAGYDIQSNAYALIDGCTISGSGYTWGVGVKRGGNAEIANCTFLVDSETAAMVQASARAHFNYNVGNGKLTAYKGVMTAEGTVPLGGVEYIGTFKPDNVDTLEPTATQTKPPESGEPVTKTYTLVHSDSYRRGWSYFEDSDIRQGYNGYPIYGTMWFDTAQMQADLAEGAVKQASIGLYMMTGVGRGVSVSVQLWGGVREYEGRTTAPESMVSYGTIGTVAPGQMNEMTIPTAAIDDLVSGKTNVLVLLSEDAELYEGRAYSRNYARFAGETSGTEETIARLTVTAVGAAAEKELTVDEDGNATFGGLIADEDGNATIGGLIVDEAGSATIG